MEAGWTEWVAKGRKTKDAACVKKKCEFATATIQLGFSHFLLLGVEVFLLVLLL